MSGFTDIHSHFLYGIDDGARSRKEMLAMIDAAVADGVDRLVATPHQTPGVQLFDDELFRKRLREARAYCCEKGYNLTIFSGAELLYSPLMYQYAQEKSLSGYQGSSYILVEFLPNISFREMDQALEMLLQQGYDVVIAHIERYKCLFFRGAYRMKKKHTVRYQVNCNSVINGRTYLQRWQIKKWLRDRIIDVVATDAHGSHHRPTRMREAYEIIAKEVSTGYARKVTKNFFADYVYRRNIE